ncbi:MAG: hypothetical protein KAW12_15865 [Candidatus Aminicenantes bacterium]|nr:hypothetical protein [Candidatus Aminicenantes bacterium]
MDKKMTFFFSDFVVYKNGNSNCRRPRILVVVDHSKFINEIDQYFGEIKLDSIKKEQEFTKQQRFTLETELEAIFQKGIRNGVPRNQLIYNVYYNYNVTMKK